MLAIKFDVYTSKAPALLFLYAVATSPKQRARCFSIYSSDVHQICILMAFGVVLSAVHYKAVITLNSNFSPSNSQKKKIKL